jgi:hypothetical protein
MSRTRFEDDPRDDSPARPARSGGSLLVVLLAAGALLVVVVCGGGLAFLFMARTAVRERDAAVAERQAAVATAAPPAAAGPPAADAGDGSKVRADFRGDPAGAGARWAGRRVRVTAAVTQVDPNEGDPYVVLAGPIMVLPAPAGSAGFGRLQAGAVVTVEGTVVAPAGGAPLMLSAATLVPPGP